jgi:hypothetical protein
MNALAFNHHAKSIISWVWPTSDALAEIHGQYATKVTAAPVRDFIVLGRPNKIDMKCNEVLDAAYWKDGDQVLVNVVNGGYKRIKKSFKIPLPGSVMAKEVKNVVWGNGTWSVEDGEVRLGPVDGISTNMAILQL